MQFDNQIEALLAAPPYQYEPAQKQAVLRGLIQDQIARGANENPAYGNYVAQWPVSFRDAPRIADLPYLPVAAFKRSPPLIITDPRDIKKVISSSATTGQVPSQIGVDSISARRMTRSVVGIFRNFLGSERSPYLVVDLAETGTYGRHLNARAAAIQGLQTFARDTCFCVMPDAQGSLLLDLDRILSFAGQHRQGHVLIYGFTYMLWFHLVQPLRKAGLCLQMPNVHILHSGGWKKLAEAAVDKMAFNEGLAEVVGCAASRVIDFYGLVENIGVVYPDCVYGNKHVPVFGEVIVRDPLTLEPMGENEVGLLQVCSIIPHSFPGHLLLTEDMARVIDLDGCPCGRRGLYFRFVRRVPKAEVRGCGNIQARREVA